MATDLSSLERRLARVADRLTESVEGLITDIGEEIGRELLPATPVDTGFARANWRPSINFPSDTPVSFLDPSGQATISRIISVAKRFRVGDTIFITNRIDYIDQLNRGSSPQAPPGFVEIAVNEGTRRAVARRGELL